MVPPDQQHVKLYDHDVKVERSVCDLVTSIQAISEVRVAILIQSNMSNVLELDVRLRLSNLLGSCEFEYGPCSIFH